MILKFEFTGLFLFFALCFISCNKKETPINPNIIIVYMDDLGYGDVSYNGASKLQTPNMDAMAMAGMRFNNGYATSATCTPSRYALLTGVYPWREKRAKILAGTAPLIIGTDQMTLPKMLKQEGYQTAIIGKWHLGLGNGNVNWNKLVSPGPNQVGFDYSYILAATQDRVPTVYIEDGKVVGLDPNDPIEVNYQKNFKGEPTGLENPELLTMNWHHGHNSSIVNGIPRIGFMRGGEAAKWSDVDMADHFLNGIQKYIKSHKGKPFFLYYPMQQPHVPRTPHPRFEGLSELGPRGDAIVEADWCLGELKKTLEAEGIIDNTLIIFSSDNGPVLNDGYYDDSDVKNGDHLPSGPLRGGKYSLFEAGTRVPFFTYWKGKIKPGVSDSMVSQLDLLSSLAQLVGSKVRTGDSLPLLELLMGQSDEGRDEMVIEATSRTAYKRGDWVMIPPYEGPALNDKVQIELGNASDFQLYNLAEDIEQQNNLAALKPDKLQEMLTAFEAIRGDDYGKIEKLELK
jgi:arylsulfatase A-like enzyme